MAPHPCTPEHDDQTARPQAVGSVAGVPHGSDDVFDPERIGPIAASLVTRRTASVEGGHRLPVIGDNGIE